MKKLIFLFMIIVGSQSLNAVEDCPFYCKQTSMGADYSTCLGNCVAANS